jgi:hypothetical protein
MRTESGQPSGASRSPRSTSKRADQAGDRVTETSTFFPFFEYLTQTVDIPSPISCIVPPWFTIQTILCVLWLPGSSLFGRLLPLDDLATFLSWVGVFAGTSYTEDTLIISLIVCAITFFIILILEGIVLFAFAKLHTYVRVLLLPSRIASEILPMIIAYPCAYVTGRGMVRALESLELKFIMIFVAGALLLILYLIIFRFGFTIIGGSTFLAPGPLAAFESGAFLHHLTGSALLYSLSHLATFFDAWFWYVLLAGHALAHAFFAYEYGTLPFISPWVNVLFL